MVTGEAIYRYEQRFGSVPPACWSRDCSNTIAIYTTHRILVEDSSCPIPNDRGTLVAATTDADLPLVSLLICCGFAGRNFHSAHLICSSPSLPATVSYLSSPPQPGRFNRQPCRLRIMNSIIIRDMPHVEAYPNESDNRCALNNIVIRCPSAGEQRLLGEQSRHRATPGNCWSRSGGTIAPDMLAFIDEISQFTDQMVMTWRLGNPPDSFAHQDIISPRLSTLCRYRPCSGVLIVPVNTLMQRVWLAQLHGHALVMKKGRACR